MAETLTQTRLRELNTIEAGIPSGREITLVQLIEHNYPAYTAEDKLKLYGVINFLNNALVAYEPYGNYAISPETVLPILSGEQDMRPSNDLFPTQCLKLDLTTTSHADMVNAITKIKTAVDHAPRTYSRTAVFRNYDNEERDAYIYKMPRQEDRIDAKTPYIIVQEPMTAIGDLYFDLKMVVFDDEGSEEELDFSQTRTIFEMRIADELETIPLQKGKRISLDKTTIPWINNVSEIPLALVPQEFMETMKREWSMETDDLLDSKDPNDNFDLIMLTARLVYLTTLTNVGSDSQLFPGEFAGRLQKAITRIVLAAKKSDGMTPYDRIYYVLKSRGEDYHEEAVTLVSMMVKAYLTNREVFLRNLQATGLDQIFPDLESTVPSDQESIQDIFNRFRLFSGQIPLNENIITANDSKLNANYMNFAIAVAKENIEHDQLAGACFVLKNGVWVALKYFRKKDEQNTTSEEISTALEMAAERLGDPELNDCVVVSVYGPDQEQAWAIRKRTGIKRVVYAIPNPNLKGEEQEVIDILGRDLGRYGDYFGQPVQVIAGLLRRKARELYRTYSLFPEVVEQPAIFNYSGKAAPKYLEASRAQRESSGSWEREKILEILGSSDLRGLSILDSGCHTGDEAAWFNGLGADVRGVDIDPYKIMQAREDHKKLNIKFKEGNITYMPYYKDGEFDVILCKYVLNEIEPDDIEKVYAEFCRCLKPGGRLILFIHHPISQNLSRDVVTNDVAWDFFARRKVIVSVYPGVEVVEPTHSFQDLFPRYFTRHFGIDDLAEGQDEQKIHPDKKIQEYLFVSAYKK